MESELKILRRTSDYIEVEAGYKGYPIQIRYHRDGRIEVRFTDDFARANGYRDKEDFILRYRIQGAITLTGVPVWIEVTGKGYRWEKRFLAMN